MTDRWILVDVGQVLIGFDHAIIGRRLVWECFPAARQTPETLAALEAFILGSSDGLSRNSQLDRGLRTVSWLREQVCAEFQVDIAAAPFEEIWTSIFAPHPNRAVIAGIEAWRARGARIGICSNTNPSHWSFLRRQHPDFRRVTDAAQCFLSFEMGEGKGDPGFFERIVSLTGATPADLLLLDDIAGNCDAARAAGLQAVLYDPANGAAALQAVTNLIWQGASDGA